MFIMHHIMGQDPSAVRAHVYPASILFFSFSHFCHTMLTCCIILRSASFCRDLFCFILLWSTVFQLVFKMSLKLYFIVLSSVSFGCISYCLQLCLFYCISFCFAPILLKLILPSVSLLNFILLCFILLNFILQFF